jgi:type II secretory pathway pseudopilin PulG
VIGIIAILIALLLPSLTRARQQAASIKCRANLKQIGAALQLYLNDNHQFVPHANPIIWNPNFYYDQAPNTPSQPWPSIATALSQYLPAGPVWDCPADHITAMVACSNKSSPSLGQLPMVDTYYARDGLSYYWSPVMCPPSQGVIADPLDPSTLTDASELWVKWKQNLDNYVQVGSTQQLSGDYSKIVIMQDQEDFHLTVDPAVTAGGVSAARTIKKGFNNLFADFHVDTKY